MLRSGSELGDNDCLVQPIRREVIIFTLLNEINELLSIIIGGFADHL